MGSSSTRVVHLPLPAAHQGSSGLINCFCSCFNCLKSCEMCLLSQRSWGWPRLHHFGSFIAERGVAQPGCLSAHFTYFTGSRRPRRGNGWRCRGSSPRAPLPSHPLLSLLSHRDILTWFPCVFFQSLSLTRFIYCFQRLFFPCLFAQISFFPRLCLPQCIFSILPFIPLFSRSLPSDTNNPSSSYKSCVSASAAHCSCAMGCCEATRYPRLCQGGRRICPSFSFPPRPVRGIWKLSHSSSPAQWCVGE